MASKLISENAIRQVQPVHVPLHRLFANAVHHAIVDLMILDQGHQHCSPEGVDGMKIEPEIAVPCAGECAGLLLARTEGEPDPAMAFPEAQGGNLRGCGRPVPIK